MRTFLLSIALLPLLLLGGCTVDLVAIQRATVAACNFLPTAITVKNALTESGKFADAERVATIICGFVAAPQMRSRVLRGTAASPISVTVRLPNGGVATVTGYFVR